MVGFIASPQQGERFRNRCGRDSFWNLGETGWVPLPPQPTCISMAACSDSPSTFSASPSDAPALWNRSIHHQETLHVSYLLPPLEGQCMNLGMSESWGICEKSHVWFPRRLLREEGAQLWLLLEPQRQEPKRQWRRREPRQRCLPSQYLQSRLWRSQMLRCVNVRVESWGAAGARVSAKVWRMDLLEQRFKIWEAIWYVYAGKAAGVHDKTDDVINAWWKILAFFIHHLLRLYRLICGHRMRVRGVRWTIQTETFLLDWDDTRSSFVKAYVLWRGATINIWACVHMRMCTCICVQVCICVHAWIGACVCQGACVGAYVCLCVYVNGHICVYPIWILPMTIGDRLSHGSGTRNCWRGYELSITLELRLQNPCLECCLPPWLIAAGLDLLTIPGGVSSQAQTCSRAGDSTVLACSGTAGTWRGRRSQYYSKGQTPWAWDRAALLHPPGHVFWKTELLRSQVLGPHLV